MSYRYFPWDELEAELCVYGECEDEPEGDEFEEEGDGDELEPVVGG